MKTMMAALGAAFLLVASIAARAQVQCAPATMVAESLSATGMRVAVTGIDTNGARFEVWEDGERNWVLVIRPSARPELRCGIAGGEDLRLRGTGHPPMLDPRDAL